MTETNPITTKFIESLGIGLDAVQDVLVLFTQAPTVYFVALAFTGAAVGVARRFIPMKKR